MCCTGRPDDEVAGLGIVRTNFHVTINNYIENFYSISRKTSIVMVSFTVSILLNLLQIRVEPVVMAYLKRVRDRITDFRKVSHIVMYHTLYHTLNLCWSCINLSDIYRALQCTTAPRSSALSLPATLHTDTRSQSPSDL